MHAQNAVFHLFLSDIIDLGLRLNPLRSLGFWGKNILFQERASC